MIMHHNTRRMMRREKGATMHVSTKELQRVFGLTRREAVEYHRRFGAPTTKTVKGAVRQVRKNCETLQQEVANAAKTKR